MTAVQGSKVLLIVDLQQDFISPEGSFKKKHIRANHIISNLRVVLPTFRLHGTVIWIKSNYSKLNSEPKYHIRPEGKQFGDVPMNDARLSGTHKSFPMCIPGQAGEKFIDDVYSILDEDKDQIIHKTYYSAFTDTNLVDILKQVQEVHICGLTTNNCILATATDAFFHGYKVFIWTDCLGYRCESRHNAALESIAKWYGTLTTSRHCLDEHKPLV